MVTFCKDMIHEFITSFRRQVVSGDVPDRSRELDRRCRALADGYRAAHHDPLRAHVLSAASAAGTDAIGRVVWESAVRARKLGDTVALVRDEDIDDPIDRRPGHTVVSAWLGGLALWAIVLFLLGAE